jgi:DNA polymerase elongation subunit (family B)
MSKFYTHFSVRGNSVLYTGYDHGRRVQQKIPYKPSLFLPSKKSTKYISYDGKKWLDRIKFDSISEARDYVNNYGDVDNYEVWGLQQYDYACISDMYENGIDYDLNRIKVLYFDIETTCESGFPSMEVFDQKVIAITCGVGKNFVVFGLGDYTPSESNVEYRKCSTETQLLCSFVEHIKAESPDVISGYNITFFDIPYLVGRMNRLIEKDYARNISPWNEIKTRTMTIQNKTYTAYDFLGIVTLDYIEIYKKFHNAKPENYKLDTVAKEELGEAKITFDGNLKTLYTTNFQKFIDYNIHDVRLVMKLEEKLKIMEMIMTIAYDSLVNFMDVFKQVRLWDIIIFNHIKKMKMIIPPRQDGDKEAQYEGAAVKEPIIGMHKWISSFDVNSLYPMLIVQYNISPEKLLTSHKIDVKIEDLLSRSVDLSSLKKDNLTFTANGHFFSRKGQGFLPAIIEKLYTERKKYKSQMIECKNELQKIKQELRRRGLDD